MSLWPIPVCRWLDDTDDQSEVGASQSQRGSKIESVNPNTPNPLFKVKLKLWIRNLGSILGCIIRILR